MIEFRVNLGHLEVRGDAPEEKDMVAQTRDLFEERAAVLEYEAGFTRVEAERRALAEVLETMKVRAA